MNKVSLDKIYRWAEQVICKQSMVPFLVHLHFLSKTQRRMKNIWDVFHTNDTTISILKRVIDSVKAYRGKSRSPSGTWEIRPSGMKWGAWGNVTYGGNLNPPRKSKEREW